MYHYDRPLGGGIFLLRSRRRETKLYFIGGGGSGDRDPATDGGGSNNTDPTPPEIPKPKINNQLTNDCAKGIFNNFRKTGNALGNSNLVGENTFDIPDEILAIFKESTRFNFIIKNSNDPNQAEGNRIPGTNKIEWTVNLNNDYLNKASQLSKARTIIHEMLHVYISYKLFTDFNYNSEFEKNYVEYIKKRKPHQMERAQHEFMGEYVNTMAYSLKTWDKLHGNGKNGGQLLEDGYYHSMAFAGLFKNQSNSPTDSFKELIPSGSERLKILNIIRAEQESENNKGTSCN